MLASRQLHLGSGKSYCGMDGNTESFIRQNIDLEQIFTALQKQSLASEFARDNLIGMITGSIRARLSSITELFG